MEEKTIRGSRKESPRSYLIISGAALIGTGGIYVLMSVLPALLAVTHESQANGSVEGFAAFGWLTDAIAWTPRGIVAVGLLVQIAFGWILGVFTIVAGIRALHGERLSFVRKVTVANLFYVPIGSTVGAMLLLGFRRPGIRAQFGSE